APLLKHSPIGELDFALLRLAEPAGNHEVTGRPGVQRGFIRPQAIAFENGAPLIILQHPNESPLKIRSGSIRRLKNSPKRILYSTNTREGSSGAPCFTHEWELVALHQAGDEAVGNYGIPCADILPLLPKEVLENE